MGDVKDRSTLLPRPRQQLRGIRGRGLRVRKRERAREILVLQVDHDEAGVGKPRRIEVRAGELQQGFSGHGRGLRFFVRQWLRI